MVVISTNIAETVNGHRSKEITLFAEREIDGPEIEIVRASGEFIVMNVGFDVFNGGGVVAEVGIRLNMVINFGALFDFNASQFIVEADGEIVRGDMPLGSIQIVAGNGPLTLAPAQSARLFLVVSVPTDVMWDRQGSVLGFQWWRLSMQVRDNIRDVEVDGDSNITVKSWFKLVPAAGAASASNPGYDVAQVLSPGNGGGGGAYRRVP